MATTIGCSQRTIHRRLDASGLSVRQSFTTISDDALDDLVSRINRDFPRHGYRNVDGHLLAQGVRVSHRRVRQSLARIDTEGVALRWSYTIERRTYNVTTPNALWHIDGLHALVTLVRPKTRVTLTYACSLLQIMTSLTSTLIITCS